MKFKLMKKLVAIATSASLVLGLAVGVSAAAQPDANTVQVKIYLQTLDRWKDNNNDGIAETKLTTPIQNAIGSAPVTVTVSSTATLMDAVIAANLAQNSDNDDYWTEVPLVDSNYQPTGETGWALNEFDFGANSYVNEGSYNGNSYQGHSIMWFYGTPSDRPADGANYATENYPTEYLSQILVSDLNDQAVNQEKDENGAVTSSSYEFTLSYEFDVMTW